MTDDKPTTPEMNQAEVQLLAQREAELAVISSVQQALAARMTMREIYEVLGEKIRQIFDAQAVIIGTYDPTRPLAYIHYWWEKGERYYPGEVPLSGIMRYMLEEKKTLVVNRDFIEWSEDIGVTVSEGEPSKSGIFVPLGIGGDVFGAISLQNIDREDAFSETDVRLLETLANSMSMALENARLFDETNRLLEVTEQRNAELTIVNTIGEGLASKLEFKAIIDLVGDKVQEIFQADTTYIALYDADTKMGTAPYYVERGHRHEVPPRPLGEGLWSEVIRTREAKLYGRMVDQTAGTPQESPGAGTDLNESYLGVPILVGDDVIGVLSVQSYQRHAFNEADMRLLSTIASNMGVALENARLFDETNSLLEESQQRNAELAVINSVQQGLVAQMDLQGIYDLVGDQVRKIFDAQVVTINRFDVQERQNHYLYVYEKGQRFEIEPQPFNPIIDQFISSGETFLVNTGVAEVLDAAGAPVPAGEKPKSILSVPLRTGNLVTGAISLQNVDREHAFRESDVRLLETIANSMSIALENARLFDETNRLLNETEVRNAELAVINKIQEGLVAKVDMQSIYDLVGDKIREIFDAQVVTINALDIKNRVNHYQYVWEKGIKEPEFSVPFVPLIDDLIQKPRTMIYNEGVEELIQAGKIVIHRGAPPRSFVLMVMQSAGQVSGYVSLQNIDKEHAFSDSDVSLLTTIVNSLGIALENAHLFDETQRLLDESRQRAGELATVNAISQAMTSELELGVLIALIGDEINKIFRPDISYIALHDRQTDMIDFPFAYGEEVKPLPYGEGLTSQILKSGEPLLINREEDWKEAEKGVQRVGVRSKSFLGVPIMAGRDPIGVISVQSTRRAGRFDESDARLLGTIAASVGASIRNAQLYQETQLSAGKMAALAEVARQVSETLDFTTVLNRMTVSARDLLAAQASAIFLLQSDGVTLKPITAVGDAAEELMAFELCVGEGIIGDIVGKGVPEIVHDTAKDTRGVHIDGTGHTEKGEKLMVALLLVRERTIGAMAVWRQPDHDQFTESDLDFLTGLSRHAAIAIENARLFDDISRQKNYYETIIANSPAAIVVISPQLVVTSWNPAAERLFGYTPEEAIGNDVDSLVANQPEVYDEARELSERGLRDKYVHFFSRRTRKDGSLVDVEVLGLPVIVDGEITDYVVIYHDITELEHARQEAIDANRAKSTFLANMSHELRTPLNAIIGFTRIVKRKGKDTLPEKQVENLDKVLVSAEHLLDLINTILDISKIEAGRVDVQISTFEIEPIVDLCLNTSQPLVKMGVVKLVKEIQGYIPPLCSDQDKVKQILLNLISNAAKFTHQGEIIVRAWGEGQMLKLAVKDTGIGISEEALETIFEEFQQADTSTSREYGGTGLGLSISRSLAQLLGGDIIVESEVGVGTTFTVTLPLNYDMADSTLGAQENELAGAPVNHSEKPVVLVIDDNEDVLYIVRESLEEAGYVVVGALNGDEGITKARELNPFAITLDIMMPDKNGWQVLHELKADPQTRAIPVILVTIVDKKALGYRLGAADYLVKPLDETALLEAFNRLAKISAGRRPKRILVVDDDPLVFDMVEELLEETDYKVSSAANGMQALEAIQHRVPDVILLDLMMPELDGFGVLEQLGQSSAYREIPVIVLTAKSLTASEEKELNRRVSTIIEKRGLTGKNLIHEIRDATVGGVVEGGSSR